MPIFTVSGLRGVYGKDLLPSHLLHKAMAFGEYIGGSPCAVGRDTRKTSEAAFKAVAAGLLERGCVVYDLGVTTTPMLFYEVKRRGLKGGIMVTASHNPPEWNGVKFIVEGGRTMFSEELDVFSEREAGAVKLGLKYGKQFQEERIHYLDDLTKFVGRGSCKGLKVALDPGGGSGSIHGSSLFQSLGCKALSVNDTLGVFSRTIDPTVDRLEQLTELVKRHGCDLGFAFDCDADRVVVVDENGVRLRSDYTMMVCLKHLLNKERVKRVAATVDTSDGIKKLLEDAGGELYYTKVGEANVVKEILERDCQMGGEGSSGGIIVPEFVLCRDGLLASALIARFAKEEGSLSALIRDLPHSYVIRSKVECNREFGEAIVTRLAEGLKDVDEIDGVKIKFSDGSWILIRPSNTEDVIRISVEARGEQEAESLLKRYVEKITRLVDEVKRDQKS